MFKKIIVEKSFEGLRLDKFLAKNFNLSLRKARYLINKKVVWVNSFIKTPQYRVRWKDEVLIEEKDELKGFSQDVKILLQREDFFAVEKPSFLHTSIGKENLCLENILDKKLKKSFILLNRLDYMTGGIVVGCFEERWKNLYKFYQDQGMVEKFYLALVKGKLDNKIVIRYRIDDKKRKKVKVLNEKEKNFLRFSFINPIHFFDNLNRTLVLIKILKGKRHQIRSHLSFIGHPIIGDNIYGAKDNSNFLFLYHFMIKFPDFIAYSFPLWIKDDLFDKIKKGVSLFENFEQTHMCIRVRND